MKRNIKTDKGFTLVEIIIVMVLVGIIAAVAGMGYVKVVKGMLFTKMNASTIQKGQVAITKLVKEFTNISISSVTAASETSITFSTIRNGVTIPDITVMLSGDTVKFGATGNESILADHVSDFKLRYYDNYDDTTGYTTWQSSRRIIEITLKLKGADDVVSEFKARVKPRNL